MSSARRGAATIAAIFVIAFGGGILTGRATAPAPGPAACSRPSLPSGDQELVHGVIWTCTDGVWHTR